MSKLEKIETEYMLFEEEKCLSSESVYALLEYYHYEMNYTVKMSLKAIRQNNLDYKIEKIKNVIGQFLGYEIFSDWLLEDNECLRRQIGLAESFDKYFIRLCEQLDDDNFLDISKLSQFTLDKYLSNYNYLESLRDGINMASSGIIYCGKGESDEEEFSVFFEEEFSNFKVKEKSLEKS